MDGGGRKDCKRAMRENGEQAVNQEEGSLGRRRKLVLSSCGEGEMLVLCVCVIVLCLPIILTTRGKEGEERINFLRR